MKNRLDSDNFSLFLNRFGEPLGDRGVQKMLRKYIKRAKLDRTSVHTLRHTFGFYQATQGSSPIILNKLMGNKDNRSATLYHSLANKIEKRNIAENQLPF